MTMTTRNFSIDRLNLRLPAAFASRANAIARMTAKQLATVAFDQQVEIAQLNVPALRLRGNESNRQVATKIAAAIGRQVMQYGREQAGRGTVISSGQPQEKSRGHHAD